MRASRADRCWARLLREKSVPSKALVCAPLRQRPARCNLRSKGFRSLGDPVDTKIPPDRLIVLVAGIAAPGPHVAADRRTARRAGPAHAVADAGIRSAHLLLGTPVIGRSRVRTGGRDRIPFPDA